MVGEKVMKNFMENIGVWVLFLVSLPFVLVIGVPMRLAQDDPGKAIGFTICGLTLLLILGSIASEVAAIHGPEALAQLKTIAFWGMIGVVALLALSLVSFLFLAIFTWISPGKEEPSTPDIPYGINWAIQSEQMARDGNHPDPKYNYPR